MYATEIECPNCTTKVGFTYFKPSEEYPYYECNFCKKKIYKEEGETLGMDFAMSTIEDIVDEEVDVEDTSVWKFTDDEIYKKEEESDE
jgi:hypothetical protein